MAWSPFRHLSISGLTCILFACQTLIGIEDIERVPDSGVVDASNLDVDAAPDAAVDAAPDAAVDAAMRSPVAHLSVEASLPGDADLILEDATIDTTYLTIDSVLPVPEGIFAFSMQEPWLRPDDSPPSDDVLPQLAVLRVGSFTIRRGATVDVTGAFPLVIVAAGSVTIDGILDVSADGSEPGPGAARFEMIGVGGHGSHVGSLDSGGGGGGYGLPGPHGGDAPCDGDGCTPAYGGVGGTAYGSATLMVLQGGAFGGGNSCDGLAEGGAESTSAGGAGGGAVQVYSEDSITIADNGGIDAGGGGGGGGNTGSLFCNPIRVVQGHSGRGGGAGGAIFLQAPRISNYGIIAANGGGGGGSAGDTNGGHGQDGALSDSPAESGASGGGIRGAAGGQGGARNSSAAPGGDAVMHSENKGQGGGGGGAVGRIVIVTSAMEFDNEGTVSPAPLIVQE